MFSLKIESVNFCFLVTVWQRFLVTVVVLLLIICYFCLFSFMLLYLIWVWLFLYYVQIAIFENLSLEIISGLSLYLCERYVHFFSQMSATTRNLDHLLHFSFWDDLSWSTIFWELCSFGSLLYVWDTAFWNQNLRKPDSLLSPTFLAGPGHQSIALCIAKVIRNTAQPLSHLFTVNVNTHGENSSRYQAHFREPLVFTWILGFPRFPVVIDFFILRFAILLVLSTQLV